MNTNHALTIAITFLSLASYAYVGDSPVTESECIGGGGVVYTDANGYQACDGGTFHGRFVL
jgi:hypothetical protein